MRRAVAVRIMLVGISGLWLCGAAARAESPPLDDSASVQQELERLRQLRQQDPGQFREAVAARKAQLHGQLRQLKARDPERFQQLMTQMRRQRQQRLEQLQATNPERYQEFMSRRRAQVHQRLEQLQQEDPQRYEALKTRLLERRKEALGRLQQADPERHRQFLQRHPHWTEQLDEGSSHGAGPPALRPRGERRRPSDQR